MKDESKQTELQAHIFQTPSITVERFPLSNRYNIAHAQFTHCILSFREFKDFGNWVFYRNLEKEFTLLLSCIYYY